MELPNLGVLFYRLLKRGFAIPVGEKEFAVLFFSFSLLVMWAFFGAAFFSRAKSRGKGFAAFLFNSLLEPAVELMGEEVVKKYGWFFLSFFFFVLSANLMGLFFFSLSPTSSMNTTVPLAVVGVLGSNLIGFLERGWKSMLLHYLGTPIYMAPLFLPLNIVEEFSRCFSLSVRLFGNVFGDETLIAYIVVLSASSPLPLPSQFPVYFLSVLTSFIQAYLFYALVVVYTAGFLEEE